MMRFQSPLVSPPSRRYTGPPGLYELASNQYRWQKVPLTESSKWLIGCSKQSASYLGLDAAVKVCC
jgi:hypothetical protein